MSLADALQKTPLLETLEVTCLTEPSLVNARPIILPHLRNLHLSGTTGLCATLFRVLDIPRNARVALSPPGFEGPMSSVPMILGRMSRILLQLTASATDAPEGAAPFAHVLSLDVVFGYEGCRLRGWRRVRALGQWRVLADNTPDVLLGLTRHTSVEDAVTLLSTLPLHHLQVLRIHWLPHADTLLPYMRRLATLTALQVLVLDDISIEVVLELAAVATAQEVWLMGIDFEGVREAISPYSPGQASSSDRWLALVEICAIRAASGLAFSRVYVEGGREINELVVAMLREVPGTEVELLEQRPPGASRRW
ncbi:hypothetical protein PsYK624_078530 [Phanerochaete sordida]|uniref:Uncharacterized protein n=1 Tax=Phanerochaete sordida TaxID=48140 RepID=A0A9P3GB83_9APHY|nr:hypothetical protein PsYK624_078530 [Phanerochaete sordida]